MNRSIQIVVNGQKHLLDAPCSLETLLKNFKIDDFHVAVAVNEEIVSRSQREKKSIQNGDRIEVVRAVAGG